MNRERAFTIGLLLTLAALTIFTATYFNYDNAFEDDGLKLSGTDPYYHRRITEYIVENKAQLVYDPMMDYPKGAFNPWPPLFDWVLAVPAMVMEPFIGQDRAVDYSLAFVPSVLGALCVIAIYFLGKELFDRRTGLIASILLFLMPAFSGHIGLARADHDAIILLMSLLTLTFFVKSIKAIKRVDLEWSLKWEKIRGNLSTLLKEEKKSIATALIAGVFMGLYALTWVGYIYIAGAIIIYLGVQMVIDHIARKDSSPFVLSVLIILGVTIIITLPWYLLRYSFGASLNDLALILLVLVGVLVVSAVFLLTAKRVPSIVLLPSFAGLGGVGLYVLSAFYPRPIEIIVNRMPYFFGGTKVYKTIAEAQPTQFSYAAISLGTLGFLLAFAALAWLFYRYWRDRKEKDLFMIVWGIITIYMMTSAVRFVFNASLAFAILAAWGFILVLDFVDFPSMIKGLRGRAGVWQSIKRSVKVRHIAGIALGIGLIAPDVFFAIDVAIPWGDDNPFSNKGAFGMGYTEDWWWDAMHWLRGQDANLSDEDRPGVISWWDYGHYIMAMGGHPSISDNFQHSYKYAGLFLLAQNETEALQLILGRLLWGVDKDTFNGWLDNLNISLPNTAYDDLWANAWDSDKGGKVRMRFVNGLTMENTTRLISEAEKETGKSIQYVINDVEMVFQPMSLPMQMMGYKYEVILLNPFDSKYSAPVTLADRNRTDYYEYVFVTRDGQFVDENYYNNNMTAEERRNAGLVGAKCNDAYFNSFLYRSLYGYKERNPSGQLSPANYIPPIWEEPMPGLWMKHFRAVYNDTDKALTNETAQIYQYTPLLSVIRYYKGATVKGQVTWNDSSKSISLPGATVVVFDDYGIPHDYCKTDRNGNYSLTAPFGKNVTIRAYGPEANIDLNSPHIEGEEGGKLNFPISYEQEVIPDKNIEIETLTLNGTFYWDRYQNGEIDDNDTLIKNSEFAINAEWINETGKSEVWHTWYVETNENGEFSIRTIIPGTYRNVNNEYYTPISKGKNMLAISKEDKYLNQTVVPKEIEVSGTLKPDKINETATLKFTPLDGGDPISAKVDKNGTYTANLTACYNEYGYWQPYRRYMIDAKFVKDNKTYVLKDLLNLTVGISRYKDGPPSLTRNWTLVENATVSGTIEYTTAEKAEKAEKATITLYLFKGGELLPCGGGKANSTGVYNITGLCPGKYYYKAEWTNETGVHFMGDGELGEVKAEKANTAKKITVSRAAVVAGKVQYQSLDDSKENATGAVIEFIRNRVSYFAQTDEAGNYTINLPQGNCTLKAIHIAEFGTENETRYVNATKIEVEGAGNETTINGESALNITLKKGSRVHGNVTVNSDIKVGVLVEFTLDLGGGHNVKYVTATDTNGDYIFLALPAEEKEEFTIKVYEPDGTLVKSGEIVIKKDQS